MIVYQVRVRSRNAKGRMIVRSTFATTSLRQADENAREARKDNPQSGVRVELGYIGHEGSFVLKEKY